MSTDIFDEHKEMKSPKAISFALRKLYDNTFKESFKESKDNKGIRHNPDESRRRSTLALNWPGDELVQQLIRDTAMLMCKYDVDPEEISG